MQPPPLPAVVGFVLGALVAVCVLSSGRLQYLQRTLPVSASSARGRYEVKAGQELVKDDDSVARGLSREVRVLCWILTTAAYHKKRARHIKATWGRRCNKLVFVSDGDDPSLPVFNANVSSDYGFLVGKTMRAFDKFYSEDLTSYDWFLKADDDTYVIMENLRYMLAPHDPDKTGFFGLHFLKAGLKDGFFSGGAGYVISRETLRRFGRRDRKKCASDYGQEDVEFSKCLQGLGVGLDDSRDALGRSRFHSFTPSTHIKGNYSGWYHPMVKYGVKKGYGNISDYSVSFHYVSGDAMYDMEYFVYHLRPYGITMGPTQTTMKT